MRIIQIKKRIAISSVIAASFAGLLTLGINYSNEQNDSVVERIGRVQSENSQIKSKTEEFKNRSIEIQKYSTLWKQIPQNRKSSDGIKMNDINTTLSKLAGKYVIHNQSIKLNVPEIIDFGPFNRKSYNTVVATSSIDFIAVDDVRALQFLDEFFKEAPGYQIITSLSLKKTRDYKNDDFIGISRNSSEAGAILGKVDFVWYAFKRKDQASSPSPQPSTPKVDNAAKITGNNDGGISN